MFFSSFTDTATHRYTHCGFMLFIVALLLTGCRPQIAEPIALNGETQGTYYRILYYDSLQRNFQQSVDSLLADFDQTASLWVANSELCRVNRNETDLVSSRFADLLQASLDMNAYTGGSFDCTVGKLVNAYGFGAEERIPLSDRQIDSLLQYSGANQVRLVYDSTAGSHRIVKRHPETAIDFNAIAQGAASDMVGDFLLRQGIRNFLVDIGGEVLARGNKPDGRLWTIGIERPAENMYSIPEVEQAVTLRDKGLVTSGNYRKYYEEDGVRYSHTIHPATGRPVQHSLLSVTVIDSTARRADALATAFMVMGLEESLQFIQEHPDDRGAQTVFFIYDSCGTYRTYATPAFRQYFAK